MKWYVVEVDCLWCGMEDQGQAERGLLYWAGTVYYCNGRSKHPHANALAVAPPRLHCLR
jgi:hypothetical protein